MKGKAATVICSLLLAGSVGAASAQPSSRGTRPPLLTAESEELGGLAARDDAPTVELEDCELSDLFAGSRVGPWQGRKKVIIHRDMSHRTFNLARRGAATSLSRGMD